MGETWPFSKTLFDCSNKLFALHSATLRAARQTTSATQRSKVTEEKKLFLATRSWKNLLGGSQPGQVTFCCCPLLFICGNGRSPPRFFNSKRLAGPHNMISKKTVLGHEACVSLRTNEGSGWFFLCFPYIDRSRAGRPRLAVGQLIYQSLCSMISGLQQYLAFICVACFSKTIREIGSATEELGIQPVRPSLNQGRCAE